MPKDYSNPSRKPQMTGETTVLKLTDEQKTAEYETLMKQKEKTPAQRRYMMQLGKDIGRVEDTEKDSATPGRRQVDAAMMYGGKAKKMAMGGMSTSAEMNMRPMSEKMGPTMDQNPRMTMAAYGMMYGGKAKKK
jgi:hypothetical protein